MAGKGRAASREVYTIGHSTRTTREFKELLRGHQVEAVADVRTIPKSMHNPQFAGARLRRSLTASDIAYVWLKKLGGLRRARKDSINVGWRNASFRGFADHMSTSEFAEGLGELEQKAARKRVAIMCAETLPWRCHRSLIADALVKKGWTVRHIMTARSAPPHRLTPFLKMRRGIPTYPPLSTARKKSGRHARSQQRSI